MIRRSDNGPLVERLCVALHDAHQTGTLWTDLPLPLRVTERVGVRALLDELDRAETERAAYLAARPHFDPEDTAARYDMAGVGELPPYDRPGPHPDGT